MFVMKLLVGFLRVFMFLVSGIFFIFGLPGRLIRGYDVAAEDAKTRRAYLEHKARLRWVHDVEEARHYAMAAPRSDDEPITIR